MYSLTIKKKFILVGAIATLSVIIMLAFNQYSSRSITRLYNIKIKTAQVNTGMLTLRRNEKDFLARKDLKYQNKLNANYEILRTQVSTLVDNLKTAGLKSKNADKLRLILGEYNTIFNRLVSTQVTIGLSPTTGLYGGLRSSVHNVEHIIEETGDTQLKADMLTLRRNEKDFMLRVNSKYLKKLDVNIAIMRKHLLESNHPDDFKEKINTLLDQYYARFLALVHGYEKKGLTSSQGLQGEMRDVVHQSETLLQTMLEEVQESITEHLYKVSLISFISLLVLAVMIIASLLWLGLSILRPITTLAQTMTKMAKEKNLTMRSGLKSDDELGAMAEAFNTMIAAFEQIILKLTTSAQDISETSKRLNVSSAEITRGSDTQSERASQAATASQEMSATIIEVAKNASNAAGAAKVADDAAGMGGDSVSKTITSIKGISKTARASSEVIATLESRTQKIGKIITVIDDIAVQTNLLALNAAIEAARAGEHGRGFAVVASEVGKLAEKSTQATKEIGGMIQDIQDETGKALESMDKEVNVVEEGVSLAEDAGSALGNIISEVEQVTSMIMQIAHVSEEQSTVANQISSDIESVAGISRDTAEDAREISLRSNELAHLASDLQSEVRSFTVSGNKVSEASQESAETTDTEIRLFAVNQ